MICYASICYVRYVQNMYKRTSVSALVWLHQLQKSVQVPGPARKNVKGQLQMAMHFSSPSHTDCCEHCARHTCLEDSGSLILFAKHCFSGVLEGIALFLQSYSIECLSLERFILKPLLTFG